MSYFGQRTLTAGTATNPVDPTTSPTGLGDRTKLPSGEPEAPIRETGCPDGYKGQNVQQADGSWALLSPCRAGFKPKKTPSGVVWCCPDGGEGGGENGSPCEGGYKGQQVKGTDGNWHLLSPCRDKHSAKKDSAGNIWCCPERTEPQGCEGGHPLVGTSQCGEGFQLKRINGSPWCCPTTPQGQSCEGGYKLADNPLLPEGGSPWGETPGYNRNLAEGHWVYKDGQYYNVNDVIAFQNGTGPAPTSLGTTACRKGYAKKSINGEDYCCPEAGPGPDPGDEDPDAGKWSFSPEMQDFFKNLIGRGQEYLARRPGYSDPMMSKMFGRDFDVLRQQGANRTSEAENFLSSQGLLGTGAAKDVMGDTAWQTERGIGDLMRDLAISAEDRKRTDRADYTDIANRIFGSGMNFETIGEQLNAGRRGEQTAYVAMLLQYLTSLMSGWQ